MKKRSIGLMIVGFLFTFGIYPIYWYCSFQNQLKKETGLGFGGFGHLMVTIFTLGIYGLYWSYAAGKRIEKLGGKDNSIIYLILSIFGLGFIAYLLMQSEVNQLEEKKA